MEEEQFEQLSVLLNELNENLEHISSCLGGIGSCLEVIKDEIKGKGSKPSDDTEKRTAYSGQEQKGASEEHIKKSCPFCNGTGNEDYSDFVETLTGGGTRCRICFGRGYNMIPVKSIPCELCSGRGTDRFKTHALEISHTPCPGCRGTGWSY